LKPKGRKLVIMMISDEQLDRYRVDGVQVRVIRDALEMNDVIGTVVAWDDKTVLIRRKNRRVVQLDRRYFFQPASEPRRNPPDIDDFSEA
jgi:hypothetical protein